MNQRERFFKTVQHEEPDRVMYFMTGLIGHTFNEWEAKIVDNLPENQIVIDPIFGDLTMRKWTKCDFLDFSVSSLPHNYPRVEWEGKPNSVIDCFGSIVYHGGTYAGHPYSWYTGAYFDSLEKRDTFYAQHGTPWDEKFQPPDSVYIEFRKKLKYLEDQNYPWMPININGSIWENLFEGMSPSLVSRLMRTKPNTMHTIIDQNTRLIKYNIQRMLEAGALVVGVSDDMGQKGRPLISPKYFDEFLFPVYEEIGKMIHKAGGFFWAHSCGNITELLPSLIRAGLDLWHTLEPASGINFAQIKQTFGKKMTFVGAIDTSRILPFGTPEEIKIHVKDRLKTGMPGGGYIAGPSHDVMDIPLNNFMQMRDLIEKYGNYPCSL